MNHLSEFILDILRDLHRGKENAITRGVLRESLRVCGIDLTDRELRAVYAELPVIADSHGIYYPATADELREYKSYLRAKALPLFIRWQRVADAHPELIDAQQKELFP